MKDMFIRLCSDLDYEEMVADIGYDKYTVAMITQEEGPEKMKIEIFSPNQELKSWNLSLDDFIETLLSAKQSLIEMQKLSE